MKRPDFFLVGAPRCGTTAMNDYLAQHPEIFLAEKEMHFFGSDLDFRHHRPDRDEYLQRFAACRDERRLGEASVFYLYSQVAAGEIREFSPEARILIMLRNPIDAMFSLHRHRLYLGSEDIDDFAAALAAEAERIRGSRIPPGRFLVDGLFYRQVAHFAPQVQRYFDTFGRERVQVVLFDDFRARTMDTYREVAAFLDVDPAFAPEIEVINAARQTRLRGLRNLLRYPPAPLQAAVRALVPSRLRSASSRFLLRATSAPAPRVGIDPEVRVRLAQEIAPEVEALGDLLDRDLSHWLGIATS